jgi:rare lipoprotein A
MISKTKRGQKAPLMFFSCLLVILIAVGFAEAKESGRAAISETDSRISATEGAAGIRNAKAVYYAARYQGRKTASGEIFDHKKMTAAHPSIPLGTKVKIVNKQNGRSVVVTVNDRCLKRSYDIIDLSMAAARELGYYGTKGTARVRIIPLDEDQLALNTKDEDQDPALETED